MWRWFDISSTFLGIVESEGISIYNINWTQGQSFTCKYIFCSWFSFHFLFCSVQLDNTHIFIFIIQCWIQGTPGGGGYLTTEVWSKPLRRKSLYPSLNQKLRKKDSKIPYKSIWLTWEWWNEWYLTSIVSVKLIVSARTVPSTKCRRFLWNIRFLWISYGKYAICHNIANKSMNWRIISYPLSNLVSRADSCFFQFRCIDYVIKTICCHFEVHIRQLELFLFYSCITYICKYVLFYPFWLWDKGRIF